MVFSFWTFLYGKQSQYGWRNGSSERWLFVQGHTSGMSWIGFELCIPVSSLHAYAITLLFSAIVLLYAMYLLHFFRKKGILIGSSYTLAQAPIDQIYTTMA